MSSEFSTARADYGYSSLGASPSYPFVPEDDERDSAYNLISILGVAQILDVDFVPIHWQSARAQLGLGGTADLRESVTNIQLRFAFKRVHPSNFRYKSGELADILTFKVLFSEISILRFPEISRHPNIISLEGITWDIDSNGKLWPVLVFEKSQRGNLHNFASSSTWISLSYEQKKKLCDQIANGMFCMHSLGIVHGDLKPENILVFEETPGTYTAKICDFGFAAISEITNTIYFPEKSLWTHPCRHNRGYTFEKAALEDVYSFGMISYWLFFSNLPQYPDGTKITKLKLDGELAAFASNSARSLDMDETAVLGRLFEMTLAYDAGQRATFSTVLQLLRNDPVFTIEEPRSVSIISLGLQEFRPNFQIIPAIPQLHATDFRVRAFIRSCFIQQTEKWGDIADERVRNAHLQVACCYALGFGGEASREKCQEHMEKAELPFREIEDQLHDLNSTRGLVFGATKFREAWKAGFIPPLDPAQGSYDMQSVASLPNLCKKEIDNFEAVLDKDHPIIQSMRANLASMLWLYGDWIGAEKQFSESVNVLSQTLPPENPELLQAKGSLASIHRVLGRLAEAEGLEREVLKFSIQIHGPQHPETLVVMENLALTLAEQDRFDEAIEIQTSCVQLREQVLGIHHPSTPHTMLDLAQTMLRQGYYDRAQSIMERITQIKNEAWGPKDPDNIISILVEAELLHEMGSPEEAEKREQSALETSRALLGREHPITLDCISNLVQSLATRLKCEEAEILATEAVDVWTRRVGPFHPRTLESMMDLSMVYKEQSRWKDSVKVDLHVVKSAREVLGPIHQITLRSMGALGLDYSSLWQLDEAENILKQVIQGRLSTLGPNHVDTIQAELRLATVYADKEDYQQAIQLQQAVFDSYTKMHGENHPETLLAATNLARFYYDADEDERAIELEEKTLKLSTEHLGRANPITISLLLALAHSYGQKKYRRYKEAQELAEDALKRTLELREANHEQTAYAKYTLAQLYDIQGNLDQAEELYRDALAIRQEIFGDDHPETVLILESLEELEAKLGNVKN